MAKGVEDPHRQIHPGSGRRKGRNFPKGRQTDPDALAEVQALLGDRPRRRDFLIEHLHLIQDIQRLQRRHVRNINRQQLLQNAAPHVNSRVILGALFLNHGWFAR